MIKLDKGRMVKDGEKVGLHLWTAPIYELCYDDNFITNLLMAFSYKIKNWNVIAMNCTLKSLIDVGS